jgi:UDP-N-acetylmuramoylalanine--D-glutamate ligase
MNFSENHLDHHKDMCEYRDAKFRLFRCQGEDDIAILPEALRDLAAAYPLPDRVEYFTVSGRFTNTRLLGVHNQINLEAAYLACTHFGVSLEVAAEAAAQLKSLAHRLEVMTEKSGVLFINDSKSTTVESLRVALEAMDRPVRLLAGGVFKGGELRALLPLMRSKVKEVAFFGQSRAVFEEAWQNALPISWHATLNEACAQLWASSAPGEAILLSPATSSFDLYRDYKARGDDFRRIVEELK